MNFAHLAYHLRRELPGCRNGSGGCGENEGSGKNAL